MFFYLNKGIYYLYIVIYNIYFFNITLVTSQLDGHGDGFLTENEKDFQCCMSSPIYKRVVFDKGEAQ